MSAVFDFAAINRRLNRKPEPIMITDMMTGQLVPAPECLCCAGPHCVRKAQMAALRAEVEQMERKLDLQAINEAKFQRYKAES